MFRVVRYLCSPGLKRECSQLIHLLPTMVFKKAAEHDKGVSEEDDKVSESVMLQGVITDATRV